MFLKNKNIIFKIRRSKVTDYAALNTHRILKLAKSLIRLRVCAGKSEHLLVRHTTLLLVCAACEISILGFNPCIPISPYRVLWQTVKT